MDLAFAIVIYFAFVALFTFIFYRYGMNLGASLIVSFIFGQFILNILKPPQDVDSNESVLSSSLIFYLTIQFLTPIIAMIVVILYAFKDRRIVQQ